MISEAQRSIKARMRRAELHIRKLEEKMYDYIAKPLPTSLRLDKETNEIVVTLEGELPTVPPDFNIICGEALYQLRCILDNLINALVVAADNKPSRINAFPIFVTLDKFEKSGIPQLKGVGEYIESLVRSCQPFQFGKEFEKHPLWILNTLNNADKHRFALKLDSIAMPWTVSCCDYFIIKHGTAIFQEKYSRGSECFRYPARFPDIGFETVKIEVSPMLSLFFDEMDEYKPNDQEALLILSNIKEFIQSRILEVVKDRF